MGICLCTTYAMSGTKPLYGTMSDLLNSSPFLRRTSTGIRDPLVRVAFLVQIVGYRHTHSLVLKRDVPLPVDMNLEVWINGVASRDEAAIGPFKGNVSDEGSHLAPTVLPTRFKTPSVLMQARLLPGMGCSAYGLPLLSAESTKSMVPARLWPYTFPAKSLVLTKAVLLPVRERSTRSVGH